jgi:hypothetical protein
MATATRMITHTEVTHVSVMAKDQDINLATVEHGLRVLTIAGVHVYFDENGITALLEKLLDEPEAMTRADLLPVLSKVAEYQQTRALDMTAQAV